MITEKWHDLRKNPDDLPKTSAPVWVVLADNPTEIKMDSYNSDDTSILSVGWWLYDLQEITHWMPIEKPEPPEVMA